MTYDCVIVGAGLSGLYSAYLLASTDADFRVLEARPRIGGRIDCATRALGDEGVARYDLGPAWIWPELQPTMMRLLQTLDIDIFPQATHGAALYEDASTPVPQRMAGESPHAQSYRIAGGALSLAEALAGHVPDGRLSFDQRVTRVTDEGDTVLLETEGVDGLAQYRARQVVFALPLRLLARSIRFEPALPPLLYDSFVATPTWMAGQAKFVAFYDEPLWEQQGLSGEVFSRLGPLTEVYDASPREGGPAALFGFYGLPAQVRRQLGEESLLHHTLAQLGRLFGSRATRPTGYRIKDWSEDPLTATEDDLMPLTQHPEYGLPEDLASLWEGRLVFSGSETVPLNGGYLEGALEAGEAAFAALYRGSPTDQ
ncbi:MAG: FAD-dependent oxidoreductase [Gammaproteobacteria bacterium]|jgi:monoamine oxidase